MGRVATVLITALVWWVILLVITLVFASGSQARFVSTPTLANITALALLLVPFFTTHGVLINFRDALLRGRVLAPETSAAPGTTSQSPWRTALVNTLRFGVPAAVAGYALVLSTKPVAITAGAFAWRLAPAGALLSALTAWVVSGRAFMQELRVPPAGRRFDGQLAAYLRNRHALPHGLSNALINGAAAFALVPDSAEHPGIVPAKLLLGDTAITILILTAILTPTVITHARIDATLGVMPPSAAGDAPAISEAVMPPMLIGIAATLLLTPLFWLIAFRPSVELWALYRTLAFGGYSAWIAWRVARAASAGVRATP